MKKIVIGIKDPGEEWRISIVEDALPEYQRIVKGYIEHCYSKDGIEFFCNEEGRINDMPVNLIMDDVMIFGPVFAVRTNEEGEFEGLTMEDIAALCGSEAAE